MENFPRLNSSPSPKLTNPQIVKSSASAKYRIIPIQTNDSFLDQPNPKIISTPKKISNTALYKEISRLEEELDYFEIGQNNFSTKDFPDKKQKQKELKLYARFLDGIIYSIGQVDSRICKCLNRGWTSYQRALNKKVRKNSPECVPMTTDKNDVAVQSDEIFDIGSQDMDLDNYIDILNSLILRVNNMNHRKVINSLQKLLSSLKPIDIPNISDISNLPKQLFEAPKVTTQKSLQISNDLSTSISKNKLGSLQMTRVVQTELTVKDFSSWDYLKILVRDRDKEITKLTEKIHKLEKIEKEFNAQKKEIFENKLTMQEIAKNNCRECEEKAKKLAEKIEEIKELKQAMAKNENNNIELEKTRDKLRESFIILNKKDEKIKEINENLDELKKKVEQFSSEQENFERKSTYDDIRMHKNEWKAHPKMNSSIKIKPHIKDINNNNREVHSTSPNINHSGNIKNAKVHRQYFSNSKSSQEREEKHGHKTPDGLILSKYSNDITINALNSEIDLSFSINNSDSPYPQLAEKQQNHSLNHIIHNKLKSNKSTKYREIMKKLNITKAEYLVLSKQARKEIYQILLLHTKKCGSECEHLKRAMMIRYKDKGLLYPTKKYTIVKE
ncbi:hypothetical protein SteCoe_25614 [Stentor coeruleus]|uniref:V-SNARE coiled-coil homology domain-containing protein n=1 Tax=Stentor coeruleus TaxID=5963 RepID=A0A1R2BEU7_9CILI|nr:hypothetical protein SteCoe_25614 [Stentor coeruleus]